MREIILFTGQIECAQCNNNNNNNNNNNTYPRSNNKLVKKCLLALMYSFFDNLCRLCHSPLKHKFVLINRGSHGLPKAKNLVVDW